MTKFIEVAEEGKNFLRFIPISEIKKMYVYSEGAVEDKEYLIAIETSDLKYRLNEFFDDNIAAVTFIRTKFELL